MKEILIDIRDINGLKDIYKNKDFISLEEIICDYQEKLWEVQDLEEKIEKMEKNIQENYKRIPIAEQVEISDDDFIDRY